MSMLVLLARHRIAGEQLASWTELDRHHKWHVTIPQDPRDPLLVSDLMLLDIVNTERDDRKRAEYVAIANFFRFLGNRRSLQLKEIEGVSRELESHLTFAFGIAIGAFTMPIMQVSPELVGSR